jgi:hypothetical protein
VRGVGPLSFHSPDGFEDRVSDAGRCLLTSTQEETCRPHRAEVGCRPRRFANWLPSWLSAPAFGAPISDRVP